MTSCASVELERRRRRRVVVSVAEFRMPAANSLEGFGLRRRHCFEQLARFAFRDVEMGPLGQVP